MVGATVGQAAAAGDLTPVSEAAPDVGGQPVGYLTTFQRNHSGTSMPSSWDGALPLQVLTC
ncbi:hypothetical protein [Rhizobium mongolense]|uniref:Uncharacterized protein n=1 Tax=Rhizobium mongolense TaxID=57676 RepID=A0A7W6RJF8_9HYPH|nr:hypothetical protein [Rhizobium mongolense]MBB4273392.1 hypothetical protein [Rhizobium mongolense]